MDGDTIECIKTIALAIVGSVTTIGLAYVAARWHRTPPGNNGNDNNPPPAAS